MPDGIRSMILHSDLKRWTQEKLCSQRLGEKLDLNLACPATGQRLGSAEHGGGGGEQQRHHGWYLKQVSRASCMPDVTSPAPAESVPRSAARAVAPARTCAAARERRTTEPRTAN